MYFSATGLDLGRIVIESCQELSARCTHGYFQAFLCPFRTHIRNDPIMVADIPSKSKIFIFGYSCGAYAARVLAGMLASV